MFLEDLQLSKNSYNHLCRCGGCYILPFEDITSGDSEIAVVCDNCSLAIVIILPQNIDVRIRTSSECSVSDRLCDGGGDLGQDCLSMHDCAANYSSTSSSSSSRHSPAAVHPSDRAGYSKEEQQIETPSELNADNADSCGGKNDSA